MKARRQTLLLGVLFSVFAFFTTETYAQINFSKKEPPPESKQLDFLIGRWKNEAEFYDKDGKVTGRFNSSEIGLVSGYKIEPIMGGLFLEGGAGTSLARSWYFYHGVEKKFFNVAIDFQQNFDILAGDFVDGRLILTEVAPKKHPKGGTIMWRRTYYNIKEDSHDILMEYSRDEGKTWILSNRQKETRIQ